MPLFALVGHAASAGWSGFCNALSPLEAQRAIELSLEVALATTILNSVMGTALAWVLVRDRFRGRMIVSTVIDIPFALPTVVAGVTLMTLYGPYSVLHLTLANTVWGILAALLFVTLPFTVRSVQPLIEKLPKEVTDAATTLGATGLRAWWSVVLPALWPGIVTGAALAFARSLGEFGSVVFISGNRPFHTEVASSYVFMLSQDQQFNQAAAVSVVLLGIALVVLTTSHLSARHMAQRAVSS